MQVSRCPHRTENRDRISTLACLVAAIIFQSKYSVILTNRCRLLDRNSDESLQPPCECYKHRRERIRVLHRRIVSLQSLICLPDSEAENCAVTWTVMVGVSWSNQPHSRILVHRPSAPHSILHRLSIEVRHLPPHSPRNPDRIQHRRPLHHILEDWLGCTRPFSEHIHMVYLLVPL